MSDDTRSDAESGTAADDDGVPPGADSEWDEDDLYQEQGVQDVYVRGLGETRAELVDFGTIYDAQHSPGARGSDDEVTMTPDLVAKIIRENYHDERLDSLTGENVRQMKPSMPGALLDAITDDDMDVDVNAGGEATVSVDEGKSNA